MSGNAKGENGPQVSRSAHAEMDARAFLATEFFDATHAELIPFVSDEATWFDFDYLEPAELETALQSHYGLDVNDSLLRLPFWKVLDFLDKNRRRG